MLLLMVIELPPIRKLAYFFIQPTALMRLQLLSLLLLAGISAWSQNNPLAAIQQHLSAQAADYGLQENDITHLQITDDFVTSHNQVRHVHIAQELDGLRVINGVANVTMQHGQVVHIASRLKDLPAGAPGIRPLLSVREAIQALAIHTGVLLEGSIDKSATRTDGTQVFSAPYMALEPITAEPVYWVSEENEVHLSWSVSLYTKDAQHWYHGIVDSRTAAVLELNDWVVRCTHGAHGHLPQHNHLSPAASLAAPAAPATPGAATGSYRVFALPLESPVHGARTLEVNPADSLASPFGWHDTDGQVGPEYTITRGNNVFAYEDQANNNGPGFSPDGGATLLFDYPLNLANDPLTYQEAAITNLFYVNNRIHDIAYHYGFDEAGGNFQSNNYGRGGEDGDEVRAEAQDGGGNNNANFATPPDGGSGRMQMYLWSVGASGGLTINAPGNISGTYAATGAGFGAPLPSTPITSDLVLVDDATAPDSNDACDPITNLNLSGKIAVIRRGNCPFVDKVGAAQTAGAIAVIMINNIPGNPITMGGTSTTITIPSAMVSQADGQLIIDALKNGQTVNGSLSGPPGGGRLDGDFDNGVIVHEYGHGISNRLTGGPSAASCLGNAEQMGEGWSDWLTCMITLDLSQANPVNRPIGAYVQGNPVSGPGIRNASYDTSFAVNDYTYGDVNNGALLTQPHGVGFVWATMLWDLTWAFMNQYGIDGDLENGTGGDDIVFQLVMDGMKLQPCQPGFVDGRDAILLADQLNNNGANQCLIWETFARRGLGFSADQGSTGSRSDQTEAFDVPPQCRLATVRPSADFTADTTATCRGTIQFTDLSTNIAQSWEWDFGDGNTSIDQNPAHTYAQPGLYTVTLKVTNNIGSDTITRTDYIDYSLPAIPVADVVTVCVGDSAVLTATASGQPQWLSTSGQVLGNGDTFVTDPLTTTTTFQLVNREGLPAGFVGPQNETFGSGGQHNTTFTGTVDFTAQQPLTIRTAYVNAGSPGVRTISLWDTHSGTGNVLQTRNVPITQTGPQRITLDFDVPGAGDYSIGLSQAGLYRNNGGVQYPYDMPGVMTIVGSSAGVDFYYYFYDLEVEPEACVSDTTTVVATVIDSVDFDYTITALQVDFADKSGATAGWLWDFGDGNTSTDPAPTHTYNSDGTYRVTLTIGSCSRSYEVVIRTNVGLDQPAQNPWQAVLQPNPATTSSLLTFAQPLQTDLPLTLYATDGRVVWQQILPTGSVQLTIPLQQLAAGMYWLHGIGGDDRMVLPLMIAR